MLNVGNFKLKEEELKNDYGKIVYSYYTHLHEINVRVGDTIMYGQQKGTQGGRKSDNNPGPSTGPHLHFELREESGKIGTLKPLDYIDLNFTNRAQWLLF